MRSTSASPRLIWALLCAVWFAALAPSVSALLASRGRSWVEVCTVTGSQWRALDSAHRPDAPGPLRHKHCPYCLLQPDQATPPAPLTLAIAPPRGLERQRWQLHARAPLAMAWARLPSRAPPTPFV